MMTPGQRIALRTAALVAGAIGVGVEAAASGAIGFALLTGGDVQAVATAAAIFGSSALVAASVVAWHAAREVPFRGRVLDADEVTRKLNVVAIDKARRRSGIRSGWLLP